MQNAYFSSSNAVLRPFYKLTIWKMNHERNASAPPTPNPPLLRSVITERSQSIDRAAKTHFLIEILQRFLKTFPKFLVRLFIYLMKAFYTRFIPFAGGGAFIYHLLLIGAVIEVYRDTFINLYTIQLIYKQEIMLRLILIFF